MLTKPLIQLILYLQVNWYKGSMKLSDGERRSAVRVAGKRYRLAIAPVLRADFGNYSCVSENGLGKVRGAAATVTLTGENDLDGYTHYSL